MAAPEQRHDRVVGDDRPVGQHEAHRARPRAHAERLRRVCEGRGICLEAEHDDLHRPVLDAVLMAREVERRDDGRPVVPGEVVLAEGRDHRRLAEQRAQRVEDRPVEERRSGQQVGVVTRGQEQGGINRRCEPPDRVLVGVSRAVVAERDERDRARGRRRSCPEGSARGRAALDVRRPHVPRSRAETRDPAVCRRSTRRRRARAPSGRRCPSLLDLPRERGLGGGHAREVRRSGEDPCRRGGGDRSIHTRRGRARRPAAGWS